MTELLLVYDYISFDEEHQREYYPYTGDYAELYAVGDIVFWKWPGSGVTDWTLQAQYRNEETDRNFLMASHAYKDSEGREWGFFQYVYGMRNMWVCLSDPSDGDIPAFNPAPGPDLYTAKQPSKMQTPSSPPNRPAPTHRTRGSLKTRTPQTADCLHSGSS